MGIGAQLRVRREVDPQQEPDFARFSGLPAALGIIFMVVFAIVLLVLEWLARRARRPSLMAAS